MDGPQDWFTTGGLVAATAAGVAGCAAAPLRVLAPRWWAGQVEQTAAWIITLLCSAIFLYRALLLHENWEPLASHVDGLLLLGTLLGAVLIWEQWTRRLPGVAIFALPVLTLLMLWGFCASWWTLRPFEIRNVWMSVHLMSVYLGVLGVASAAVAGALWLLVDGQLRSNGHLGRRLSVLGRLGDLESIERAVIVSATAGFLLLSLALATGLVIELDEPQRRTAGWWYRPKVVLAGLVWAIYALVMHVRFVPTFRGRRAALLSIAGFLVLIAVLGLAQALPGAGRQHPAASGSGEAPPTAAVNAGSARGSDRGEGQP